MGITKYIKTKRQKPHQRRTLKNIMTNKNRRIMQRDGPGLVQQISCKENFIIRLFFIEEEAIKRLNI